MTAGTNQRVIWSTSPWIGSFAPCACSTMRMICDSIVSLPTFSARKVSAPVPLTVAPTTSVPSAFSTGTGSPVIMLSST